MINLRPAKSVQGKIELPASPDLLFMAALGACAASRRVKFTGISETEVVNDIIRALAGHAAVELGENVLTITPRAGDDDPAILLTLPESLLPYRMIYLFMGLGMGKTVMAKSMSEKQLQSFIAQGKRVGIAVETVNVDQTFGLRVTSFDDEAVKKNYPTEDDCAALLAFLFGKGEKLAFTIADYNLSTPLRQLAGALGLVVNAKLTTDDAADPLARRMRFLKGKQREQQEQSQLFSVEVDFSRRDAVAAATTATAMTSTTPVTTTTATDDDTLTLAVPGDEILAAALVTLKCLIPKGDLEISNAPLESWALQAVSFFKKMNCKVNTKDGGKTAFGSRGIITVQKSEFVGRKTRCIPLYQHIGQLPCMTVVASFADGKSVFRELELLRLYEPDALDQLEKSMRPFGVRHGEMPDGIVVEGAREFDGFDIQEPLPAYIATAFCVAGLKCVGKTTIADDFVLARWPEFEKLINDICEFRGK